ncbi:MAG: YdcF family protein [Desulfobacterales bacterium]|nr:YdcF family protein [Desulfobacterales bacterium]
MEQAQKNTRTDAMIVFGAGVTRDGGPGPAIKRRVPRAARLFKQGFSKNIILTGGVGRHPPAEALVMKALALREGIPEERIVIEDKSASTFQSVINCLEIMQRRNWLSAHIVTDPFHMLRCKLAFRMLGLKATGSSTRGGEHDYPKWKWIYYYLREMIAIPFYFVLIPIKKIAGR